MIEGVEIETVDSGLEKKIATGCIVSTRFVREVEGIIEFEYIRSNYIRKVIRWAVEYYREENKAVGGTVEDLFLVERRNMDEEEADFVEALLTGLSERYAEEGSFNHTYVLKEIVVPYFRKRKLEITNATVGVLVGRGLLGKAEEEIAGFTSSNVALGDVAKNPFTQEAVMEVHEGESGFFRMPGELGKFLGPFERGWLVAFMGAFKRGKSWLLEEFAIRGMFKRLNCIMFSLEMPQKKMYERFQRRMVPGKSSGGNFLYPCFDCERNQFDSCNKPQRTCSVRLRTPEGKKPPLTLYLRENNGYKPCQACRGTDSYQPDYWHEKIWQPAWDLRVLGKMKKVNEKYGRFIKQVSFPRFTANLTDVKRSLDVLDRKGWIADMIIIDYAEILKPEEGSPSTGFEKHDQTWMSLAGLAGERGALVVTATQVDKKGQNTFSLKTDNSSQWVGKNAHLDAMYTINQTAEERDVGVLRIGADQHRHKGISDKVQCTILQQLDLAQPLLDSMILTEPLVGKKEKEIL